MAPTRGKVNPDAEETPEQNTSALADELVASGAEPTTVDVNELIVQLQRQQAESQRRIEQLMAERGVPTDPIAATQQALLDHLVVQSNANPLHSADYAAAIEYAGDRVNDGSDALTEKRAARLVRHVEDLWARHPGHELAYAASLARELHTGMLDD